MREAREALLFEPHNSDEESVRQDKLRFATQELSKAWSLAQHSTINAQDHVTILLLWGLSELEGRGAREFGRAHPAEFAKLFEQDIPLLEKKISKFGEKYRQLKENRPQPPVPLKGPLPVLGFHGVTARDLNEAEQQDFKKCELQWQHQMGQVTADLSSRQRQPVQLKALIAVLRDIKSEPGGDSSAHRELLPSET